MDGRIQQILGLSPRDIAAWHHLAVRAVEPNPYFDPGNLVPAASHLPGGGEVTLAVVVEGTRMLGALPVRRARDVGGLSVLTSRVSEMPVGLGTPLLDPGSPDEAMVRLLVALKEQGRADLLVLEWLGDGGVVGSSIRRAANRLGMPLHVYAQWDRPVIRREYAASAVLGPKRAKALARWQRGIERALGTAPVFREQTGSGEWVERFLALEAAGWKGRADPGTGALAFRPGHCDWFRESVRRLAADGMARLFSLEAAERPLAMHCALVVPGAGLFSMTMSYDEELRPYAPGVQLLAALVRLFVEEMDEPLYDSCTAPGNTHFSELFPGTRVMANVLVGLTSDAESERLQRVSRLLGVVATPA